MGKLSTLILAKSHWKSITLSSMGLALLASSSTVYYVANFSPAEPEVPKLATGHKQQKIEFQTKSLSAADRTLLAGLSDSDAYVGLRRPGTAPHSVDRETPERKSSSSSKEAPVPSPFVRAKSTGCEVDLSSSGTENSAEIGHALLKNDCVHKNTDSNGFVKIAASDVLPPQPATNKKTSYTPTAEYIFSQPYPLGAGIGPVVVGSIAQASPGPTASGGGTSPTPQPQSPDTDETTPPSSSEGTPPSTSDEPSDEASPAPSTPIEESGPTTEEPSSPDTPVPPVETEEPTVPAEPEDQPANPPSDPVKTPETPETPTTDTDTPADTDDDIPIIPVIPVETPGDDVLDEAIPTPLPGAVWFFGSAIAAGAFGRRRGKN